MVLQMYVVNDKTAQESGPIFQAKNDAVAARQYRNLFRNGDLALGDYQLLCLGQYDNERMVVVPETPARAVLVEWPKQDV